MWKLFKRELTDQEIDLQETMSFVRHDHNQSFTTILYNIYLHDKPLVVGKIELRISRQQELFYEGNIGYHVYSFYQGNHYAYKACRLLFKVAAKKYHMSSLIITCNPENIASLKTIERLNGQLIGEYLVPKDHWLRKQGDIIKRVYRCKL